ncbi:hypothetical protein NDU88_000015 [Pleurodeles waltl]|uniref:Uncharacterized protein n=1 Tax=Pleurodeles waltl TaxID=8319 RepID=A0AAV7SVC8_PLEWA|nr:hypothetical protein NDU88_000015 [Pleurodeles waltl]
MLVAKKDDDTFYRRQRDLLWLGIKLITYGDDFAQFPQYLQDVSTLICKEETPGENKVVEKIVLCSISQKTFSSTVAGKYLHATVTTGMWNHMRAINPQHLGHTQRKQDEGQPLTSTALTVAPGDAALAAIVDQDQEIIPEYT